MSHTKKSIVDVTSLCKKYKCDVNKIIRAWKNNKSDYELSQEFGMDMLKLLQIRQDITQTHERYRQQVLKKDCPSKTSLLFKPW